MNVINKLLGLLPGNGKKTLVGLLTYVIVSKWPDFPVPALQALLENAALIWAALGLGHKTVKAVDSK